MREQWQYTQNKKGVSTVELLLILSALISVAFVFRDGLTGFTERAAKAVFAEPPKAERMTFGGGE